MPLKRRLLHTLFSRAKRVKSPFHARELHTSPPLFVKAGRKQRKHLKYFEPDEMDDFIAKQDPKKHDTHDFQKIVDKEVNRLGNVFVDDLGHEGVEVRNPPSDPREPKVSRADRLLKQKRDSKRAKTEEKLVLGDSVTAQKLQEMKQESKRAKYELVQQRQQTQIEALIHRALEYGDLVPTVMTCKELEWKPTPESSDDDVVQVDLKKVGFNLVGVTVGSRVITLWYNYDARAEIKGGYNTLNTVLDIYRGTIRSLINFSGICSEKKTPEIMFKTQDDPEKALRYAHRFRDIMEGDDPTPLISFGDYNPKKFEGPKDPEEWKEFQDIKAAEKKLKMNELRAPKRIVLTSMFDEASGIAQPYPSSDDLELVSFYDE